MTTPLLIVAGNGTSRVLNDGIVSDVVWREGDTGKTDAFSPAQIGQGYELSTFDGPVAIQSQPTAYQARDFSLVIQNTPYSVSGLNERWQNEALIAQPLQGNPSRLYAGSLYLEGRFGPMLPQTPLGMQRYGKYKIQGRAVPPFWQGAYTYALGIAQGITVSDDRIDQSAYLASVASGTANAVFSWTNPGTAPCAVALSISSINAGTSAYASTTVFVRNASSQLPRRIPVNLDANGNGYIDPSCQLMALLGLNLFRIETSTPGTLANGPFQLSLHGTQSRFMGNEGNRFNDSPMVFVPFRTGSAIALNGALSYSTAVNGQARIGLPTAPYVNASSGLVLEQASTNLVLNNRFANGQTAWSNTSSPTVSIVSNSGISLDSAGVPAMQMTIASGQTAANAYQLPSLTANTTYTLSGWIYAVTTNGLVQAFINRSDNLVGYATDTVTPRNQWVPFSVQYTPTATGQYSIGAGIAIQGTAGDYCLVTLLQVEATPFPTSPIINDSTTVSATRNADIAALANPSNLLAYSQDFTQWTASSVAVSPSATAAPDGTFTAQQLAFAANGNIKILSSQPFSSNTYTASIWLRTASGTATVSLVVTSIGSANLNVVAVTIADIWQRFEVSGTGSSADTGVAGFILEDNNGSAPTFLAWSAQLEEGSLPGPPVHTQGSPAYPDPAGWTWPGGQWTQNGSLTFTAVLPPVTTGFGFDIVGSADGIIRVFHQSSDTPTQIHLLRTSSDGDLNNSGPFNISAWDGNQHVFRIWWVNYKLNGVPYLIFGLDVDEVNAYTSANLALSGKIWSSDERVWLSGGLVNAVLSNVVLGFPTDKLPPGAIPAVA